MDMSLVQGEWVCLEPLRVEHLEELAPLLNDPALHTFIGGDPPDRDELRVRLARQVLGRSPDGSQRWLNWVVRGRENAQALGTVQATVSALEDGLTAEVAWIIGRAHQGQGYARESAGLLMTWLRRQGVERVVAHIHTRHEASMAVARAVGLAPTDTVMAGEVRWRA